MTSPKSKSVIPSHPSFGALPPQVAVGASQDFLLGEREAIEQLFREQEPGSQTWPPRPLACCSGLPGFPSGFKSQFGFDFRVVPDGAARAHYISDGIIIELIQQPAVEQYSTEEPELHPFQLYLTSDRGVAVRYGTLNSIIVEGTETTIVPSDGLKIWLHATVNLDGVATTAGIESGDTVPTDTLDDGYQILGEVAVDDDGNVTLSPSIVRTGLRHQMCNALHQFWGLGS